MSKARFECLYCGYTWSSYINQWKAPECEKCFDKYIKIYEIDAEAADPFGYSYVSNFPIREKTKKST